MAEKKAKSQAEKAAESRKKSKGTSNKHSGKSGKQEVKKEELSGGIPIRLISSVTCLGLFILFLIAFIQPEGWLTKAFKMFVLGLIGKTAFYIAIPALLYLFTIHAFSGKRPIILRSICLISFVLICGCLSQLFLETKELPSGFPLIVALYNGGISGSTAGLICGLVGLFLKSTVGPWISLILLIIAAALTLLAAMQITIPSIVRAVQNRPRAEWEDEPVEVPEPASVVVNHLANKRIQRVEKKRRQMEELAASEEATEDEPQPENPPVKKSKSNDFMSQIDGDVSQPVAAAEKAVTENTNVDLILTEKKASVSASNTVTMDPVPEQMPPLEREVAVTHPIPAVLAQPKVTAEEARESAAEVAAEIAQAENQEKVEYCYPPIDLLEKPVIGSGDGSMEMRENSRRLNETLASFRIEAHIINVTRGPSVTRYEVELGKGVQLNKLTTRADDIALSLGASGVRIAAVPGKISVVGIEVPNRSVNMVTLREVIDSNDFSRSKSPASFAVGKDIGGSCIVGNIAKLPHMLIAGTTGSGKSVCMNSIIISLLYKASPDDVKIIMIDPKMVELGIYNGIPHLMIPVITDPKKAAGSLQWAVTEMMRRYNVMSNAGVRDVEAYNSIIDPEQGGKKFPRVVVIIDELADLMLVAKKEVEESICRIAQMGRAAGVHLIIATQRPSADVITGLMKANIPSRIAFSVASAMESRIILDTQGAEKLVGKGDMLYAPIGTGKPVRVQGCFVSDGEVEAVATYVKENFVSDYDQQVMDEIEKKAAQTGNGKTVAPDPEPNHEELGGDEMLPAAVDVILETGQASVSMLQRRLKLGYARAARIVDEMEEKGIVGPFQGSKPRTILVTKEQWENMRSGQSTQMHFSDLSDDGVTEDID